MLVKRFPFRVTLALLMVLITTTLNFVRGWTALSWRAVLLEFDVLPAPGVIAASGFFWTVIGIVCIFAILGKKAWAGTLTLFASICYSMWVWAEKLIWQAPHPNWSFAVILNLFSVGLILFSYKTLSREAYEQSKQNPAAE